MPHSDNGTRLRTSSMRPARRSAMLVSSSRATIARDWRAGRDPPRKRHMPRRSGGRRWLNNGSKSEVGKIRTRIFAAATMEAITSSVAKDKPSNKVIAEKLDLGAQERELWLMRHGKDAGDLCGALWQWAYQ